MAAKRGNTAISELCNVPTLQGALRLKLAKLNKTIIKFKSQYFYFYPSYIKVWSESTISPLYVLK